FVFANCTIQRRTVNKGFYVKWHHSLTTESKKEIPTKNIVSNEITSSPLMDSIKEKTQEEEIEILSEFDSKNITAIDEKETENSKTPVKLNEIKSVANCGGDIQKVKRGKNQLLLNESKFNFGSSIKSTPIGLDQGIRVHIFLTVSLASFLLGIILLIRGMSTNYINLAFIPGIIFTFGGFFMFIFSLLMVVSWLIQRHRNKSKVNEVMRKRYRIFVGIEIGLAIASGVIMLLAKLLL
ncbi:MAG: hypothetical protein ACK5B9_02135, partial [Flavobacteriia bacterium]